MYPYHWTWTYTLIFGVSLLTLFVLAGVVLLVRRSRRRIRWHHTPRSISTPDGTIGYWDIRTQKMFAQGLQRARTREYYIKGRER